MRGRTILVIDDDPYTRQMLQKLLEKQGAEVFTDSGGDEGLQTFYQQKPELVIIDVMMPLVDGWEVARQIRRMANTPVIFLTAVTDVASEVKGFDLGAIDYIHKPYNPNVLLARARAALRFGDQLDDHEAVDVFDDGYLTIDLTGRRVRVSNEPIRLTKTEFELLQYLFRNKGRVLTNNQILSHVWGLGYEDAIQYVHVYISRLRKKIESDPENPVYFITEYGIGYSFAG